MKMGLREANQNFSKAIKAVKAGKVVLLTEMGKPIATIQPYQKAATDEEAIRQLELEGVLRPNEKAGVIWDSWKPLRIKGVPLSRTLRELRDDE
jgi:prevent-host-death family protein